jgi:hypothetical protein
LPGCDPLAILLTLNHAEYLETATMAPNVMTPNGFVGDLVGVPRLVSGAILIEELDLVYACFGGADGGEPAKFCNEFETRLA